MHQNKTKILRIFHFILLIIIISSYFFIVSELKTVFHKDFEQYKIQEMLQVRTSLKSLVDMAFTVLETNHLNSSSKSYIEDIYGRRLKNIIDTTESILKLKYAQFRKNELSQEQAKSEAISAIKNIRYDGQVGYVWINDNTLPYPEMIMHPTIPELDGTILDNSKFNCALGKKQNLFQAFVEICQKKGEGFVDYSWPKPVKDGLVPDAPKLSYIRLFKEWNWIIGTGIYIDDVMQKELDRSKNEVRKLRYNNGTGYFWINDNSKPIPKMIMHPIMPFLDNQILDDPKYNCPLGKGKFLFDEFVSVCEKQGSGYVEYFWPKPTKDGLIKHTPKLSYVRLYEPLKWIVGTGLYLDDFDSRMEIKKNEKMNLLNQLILKINIIFILLSSFTFLMIFTSFFYPEKSS